MAAAAQHAAALATFDVPAVAAKADAALATGGATGLEEARKLFEETLAEWGDEYARLLEEADPPLATREDQRPFEERLVALWLAYADFERKLRQWKQAVKVFESATTDVVGEKAPTLWLEYARFCRERGKFANAQKVYLRAVEVLEPAQCDVIWQALLEAVKEKGTAGVDTVAQLKAMLGIADATPEEPAAPATPAEEPTAAESVPAAVGGQEEEAVVPVPPAVKEEEDATAMEVEAEAPPLPPPPLSPVAAAAAPVTAANRGEATAPAAAEVMEQEEQPPAEQEAEEPTGPPALLFPSEALTVEDAYGHGLAPEVLERVQALLRPEKDGEPPLVMPVVEGQRIMQAFKQELAARLAERLHLEHEERSKQLALRHAAMEVAARPNPLPPHVAAQIQQELAMLTAAISGEQQQLARQLRLELGAVLTAQQKVLGEGPEGAGLPLVMPTRDAERVAVQQKVVRAVLANLQMYRATVAQQALQAEVDRRRGWLQAIEGPAGGGGGEGGGDKRKKAAEQLPQLQPPPSPPSPLQPAVGSSPGDEGGGPQRVTRRNGKRGGGGGNMSVRNKRSAAAAVLEPEERQGAAGGSKAQRIGQAGGAGEGGSGSGGAGRRGRGEGGAQDRRAILRSMMAHFQGGGN